MAETAKRILILGSSGSGKSTLATALGARLGLPVVHSDKLVWRPGWVMALREELDLDMEHALAQDAWILDGSLRRFWERAIPAADLIVHLDYPTWLSLARALRRIVGSWRQVRPDMADGCPEQFDLEFMLWIWRWRRDYRPGLMSLTEGKRVLRFSGPKELEAWLKRL